MYWNEDINVDDRCEALATYDRKIIERLVLGNDNESHLFGDGK